MMAAGGGTPNQLDILRAEVAALQVEYVRLQEQMGLEPPERVQQSGCPSFQLKCRLQRDEAIVDMTDLEEGDALHSSEEAIDLTRGGRENSGTQATGLVIEKEILKAMMRREHELRRSPITQQKYAEAEEREDTDWMDVTIELQKQVRRAFQRTRLSVFDKLSLSWLLKRSAISEISLPVTAISGDLFKCSSLPLGDAVA